MLCFFLRAELCDLIILFTVQLPFVAFELAHSHPLILSTSPTLNSKQKRISHLLAFCYPCSIKRSWYLQAILAWLCVYICIHMSTWRHSWQCCQQTRFLAGSEEVPVGAHHITFLPTLMCFPPEKIEENATCPGLHLISSCHSAEEHTSSEWGLCSTEESVCLLCSIVGEPRQLLQCHSVQVSVGVMPEMYEELMLIC